MKLAIGRKLPRTCVVNVAPVRQMVAIEWTPKMRKTSVLP